MNVITRKIKTELGNENLASNAVIPITASPVALGTLQASNPAALVASASVMARELAQVIDKQKLFTVIQGKKFVGVEGWTTLAVMLGCVAREVETVEHDGVYITVVELVRMSDGACISRASAECGDEKPWNTRAKYARRSMAQTRATGKACRLAFSWIMSLAGYEVTPAEEMTPIIEAVQVQVPVCISTNQHKLLEAKINEFGLDRVRVKSWIKTAWKIEHFPDLSPGQFSKLLTRLENWAAQEYAKSAQDDAATDWQDEPLSYANLRG